MAIAATGQGPATTTILDFVSLDPGPKKAGGSDKQIVPDAGGTGGSGSSGADLTPGGPTDISASMTLTLARIESSSGKASELFNKAVVTQVQQEKNSALEQQIDARMAARDSLLSAVGDLEKQATDLLAGAIANLVVSVVAAAVSIGFTIGGFKAGGDETKLGKALNMSSGVAMKLGESGAGFASAIGQYQSKMDEGQQKIDEANAQQYDAIVDAAKARVQAFEDFGQKLLEFIKSIREAKTEMMAAVVNKG